MFRRTAPSRSSSATVTAHRRRSGRTQVGWSPTETAALIAAPGVAVGADLATGGLRSAVTVTAEDRRAEDMAVAARLDRAWRRLEEARATSEGRPGGIGDDTARRDPVTQPFPILFGTPARTTRPVTPPAGVPHSAGQAHRVRPPRRLIADRWSAAVG